ncbi:hypothetical protein L596_009209 [Steinernema carpocapsae]|uniref:Uncharacterized protein n=1 Tax=Steinernema carpocapsae TaxID=34508 RepID=A0A4U5PFW7_STECR|nr:hypothetical protein L596_009209 [Steinernema carpocapsae]
MGFGVSLLGMHLSKLNTSSLPYAIVTGATITFQSLVIIISVIKNIDLLRWGFTCPKLFGHNRGNFEVNDVL